MLHPMAAASSLDILPSAYAYSSLSGAAILRPAPMRVPSAQAPFPPDSVLQAMNTGILAYFWSFLFGSWIALPGAFALNDEA